LLPWTLLFQRSTPNSKLSRLLKHSWKTSDMRELWTTLDSKCNCLMVRSSAKTLIKTIYIFKFTKRTSEKSSPAKPRTQRPSSTQWVFRNLLNATWRLKLLMPSLNAMDTLLAWLKELWKERITTKSRSACSFLQSLTRREHSWKEMEFLMSFRLKCRLWAVQRDCSSITFS